MRRFFKECYSYISMICSHRQSGNVLFLILIAVALFAALAYSVTRSSSGGKSVSSEQAKTEVSALMQSLSLVEIAIQKARVINSCGETEISFNGFPLHNYDSRDDCEIFNLAAGGINLFNVNNKLQKPAAQCLNTDIVFNAFFDIDKTGKADIILQINCVTDSVCLAFNEMNGISGIPSEHNAAASLYTLFSGVYNPSPPADSVNDDTVDLQGKDRFCRYHISSGFNQINYVLLRR
ncbi:hypothetical protein [Sphingobium sp. CAP-1]|uniref:hypothetical protein n=1 Tax=Sphingobium sp. CAP-1 TaxID=2676077 RepID=UPI0012BB3118|nr:hypothetical protein [Sphingobium sp. CAP-1]QGP81504.1 hypothetical protein GL174_20540 [Sphingobium sp. CAP-1]QGP81515.1 hypothetical protein GL174_20600 [Sphingobium sp. CAP-1]